jgi:hypothetical protein
VDDYCNTYRSAIIKYWVTNRSPKMWTVWSNSINTSIPIMIFVFHNMRVKLNEKGPAKAIS